MSEPQPQVAITPAEQRRRLALKAYERDRQKLYRDLMTPEGAALKLKLASAGERAGAFILDFLIIMVIFIITIFGFVFLADSLGVQGGEIALALAMVFIFLLRNFYFVFFEIGKRAATPGKRLLGLRVAARNGGRLTANAVFARNFVREVEVYIPLILLLSVSGQTGVNGWIALFQLIWFGIFLFFPVFNRDKLRAGDILAGTWVIHAPKIQLLGDVTSNGQTARSGANPSGFAFSPEQVGAYGIHELHVLEDVLRKSTAEIKRSVADRIRTKIGWRVVPGETDAAFLEAYYAALRRHLEQKLLLGQRKADKFDKS